MEHEVIAEAVCYHCGQPCEETIIEFDEKKFCCSGCKAVYDLLQQNNLCEYYSIDKNAGQTISSVNHEFDWLNEANVRKQLLTFDSADYSKVEFKVPAVHCISCLWLLERLPKLKEGVIKSEVNFSKKTVTIDFNPQKIKLSDIASAMAAVGYPPSIHLAQPEKSASDETKKTLAQLAVAGFCFGNIMLLSFPEYLGLDKGDEALQKIFSYLNLALAFPVLTFSGKDYIINAWKSFSQKQINIDVPIALGFFALYFRSMYDILSATGPGYLDSFTGLVFFLLIGRWFQSKTYDTLAFDRDYKSYFPLAIYKWADREWVPSIIYEIVKGDRIKIRNGEVIPADCTLRNGEAYIDYSFVTGESRPVKVKEGEGVYAGGRLVGSSAEMTVEKPTSQSHLTSLWNNAAFQKQHASEYKKIIDRAARKFTWAVLALTIITGIVWYFIDSTNMWLVVTSVLTVACPCALALAAPFTYGNAMRFMGRNGLYLKNADVIEKLASINSIVFDKTGTVTSGGENVTFIGKLSPEEVIFTKSLTMNSVHPLSQLISKSIKAKKLLSVENFHEYAGKGIEGTIEGKKIKIGSAEFCDIIVSEKKSFSSAYVSIDDEVRGYYQVQTSLRDGIKKLVKDLGRLCTALVSGDKASEQQRMREIFPEPVHLLFEQDPHQKLEYVHNLQQNGFNVMMVGDGLNDSGALKQSDVGIAVSDDQGVFTPACDAIIDGKKLGDLNKMLKLSKRSVQILKASFSLSFMYNFITLGIAVTGNLSPLVAAILMPISSISVVGFSSLSVRLASKKILSPKNSNA
jgi:Cu+-exporting ATPase